MKIRTEICNNGQEEIIIKCRARTDQIKNIESVLEGLVSSEREMMLHLSGVEYYVQIREILFFEAYDGKVVYGFFDDGSGVYSLSNSYQLITIGETPYMFLSLEWAPKTAHASTPGITQLPTERVRRRLTTARSFGMSL